MKYMGPMLVIKDMARTKAFYTEALGLEVISDFGANVTFTGGLSVQTESSWVEFSGCDAGAFTYQGNVVEFYFEEADMDAFLSRTKDMDVDFIGGEATMPWGQRVIRMYDPDKHIIQVGEEMTTMIQRLHAQGLSVEQLVEKTSLPKEVVEEMLK